MVPYLSFLRSTLNSRAERAKAHEMRERELLKHAQWFIDHQNWDDCESEDGQLLRIAGIGIIAGTLDKYGITQHIDTLLPKESELCKVSHGQAVRALALQACGSGMVSLHRTEKYFEKVDVSKLFGDDIVAEYLNRYTLARTLDRIHEYGCTKFFVECASHIAVQTGRKSLTIHIDTTSIHFHGEPTEESDDIVAMTFGYSRDGHPELPQIIVAGLADEIGLPIYFKGVSGNVNDKKSFKDIMANVETLRVKFPDVRYVVGDSAFCTPDILEATLRGGLHAITKLPLTNKSAKEIIMNADLSNFTDIYPGNDEKKERGQWCPAIKVGTLPVKALLIENRALLEKNTRKYRKEAEKEVSATRDKLKALSAPGKLGSIDDARKAVEMLCQKLSLCCLEDITYEEITKNCRRGRPSADKAPEKKVVGVKINADVNINEEAITKKAELSIRSIIVTTDCETDWSMEDLLSAYRGQNVIESCWRLMKNKRLLVDSIYLEKPERIEAMMCILYLIVLLLKITEIAVREAMEKHSYKLPPVSSEPATSKPTIIRFLQYVTDKNISVLKGPSSDPVIYNADKLLLKILSAMGPHWLRYYLPETYADMPAA